MPETYPIRSASRSAPARARVASTNFAYIAFGGYAACGASHGRPPADPGRRQKKPFWSLEPSRRSAQSWRALGPAKDRDRCRRPECCCQAHLRARAPTKSVVCLQLLPNACAASIDRQPASHAVWREVAKRQTSAQREEEVFAASPSFLEAFERLARAFEHCPNHAIVVAQDDAAGAVMTTTVETIN
ncbi:MAG: hypothetical protein R3B99_28750 [Polyangiales bacterium]